MSDVEVVTRCAEAVGLLDDRGRLKTIDSLFLVEFIGELEGLAKVTIPNEALTAENFASIESVAKLIASLR